MPAIARRAGLLLLIPAILLIAAGTALVLSVMMVPGDFWKSPRFDLLPEPASREWTAALARRRVSAMSDEERLSQLFMIGYEGTTPSASLLRWIRERGIGGVKIFGWNARDTDTLSAAISAIQKESVGSGKKIPVLVATDQEGGWIRHVKGRTSESPGNMAIGATGSEKDAFMAGFYIGKELSLLGINMNFAPDIDVATNPASGIIGPRAFSDDPSAVAALGAAYAKGSLKAGVIPTAKHFPGHGATARDSHGTLPIIDIDATTLMSRELVPFARLAKEGIPAVMTGHLAFPGITGKNEPASLSAELIEGYLRKKLKFGGVAITDDLYMVGALGGASIAETCERAILAGNDMIMLSAPPEPDGPLWKSLLSAYREDSAFRNRVIESAARVMALKLRHLLPLGERAIVPDPEMAAKKLPDPEAAKFFAGLARRSASVIGDAARLPFRPDGSVIIASPFPSFIGLAAEKYPGSRGFAFSYRADPDGFAGELRDFKARLAGAKAAIVCVANAAGLEFAKAAHDAGLAVAIVSVLSPYPVREARWADARIAVYHYADICLEAGLGALRGDFRPSGRVPLAEAYFR